ncbi:tRNA (adenosine(37)-N6)-threonylcarbamoyltransferase complex ATPase subunit type 1 TsaE [Kordiimonas sp.]|uniref:tRNA (adenosine(37)-N6)-threonylcarbamoyltransferase complex ATPase subunit type 1 TsaE n=1 Tax=Kordiimonas sp. TaxID=1970157 RepID=UPI003A9351FB
MPNTLLFELSCKSEKETADLAALMAGLIEPGVIIALTGDLGAGKSTFARAFIRARLDDPEAEVPSPTFTLVQTYDDPTSVEIWHADLYRLNDPEEVYELGLDDARTEAICLIEWPDRMPAGWWNSALEMKLNISAQGERTVAFYGEATRWLDVLARLSA